MNVPSHRAPLSRATVLRFMAGTALTVGGAAALSSCSLGSDAGTSATDSLTVAIWKGYGADLPWVAEAFTAKTGASLTFQYIDSLANLLQLLAKADGAIDVALPNIQYIGSGIDQGLFHPLDTAKLTNLPQIYPQFSGRPEIRKGDDLYGVPWTWGSTGLFYASGAVQPAPDSLAVLWDPAYAGRTALIDDATVLVPITALHLGEDPQNPDMTKVEPALQALKDNAKLTYSSKDDLAKAISSGAVVAGIGNSDTIGGLIGSGESGTDDLVYVVAKEGAVGWIDNWTIAAATQKVDLAYEWVNYMTGSDFLTKWAESPEDASPAPANEAVATSLDADTLTRLQAQPDRIADLALQLPQPEAVLQSWTDTWTRVKAAS